MRLPLVFLTITCASCAACADRGSDVPLAQIPPAVTTAASAALPGFAAASATSESEDGVTTYDLRGACAGKPAKVEINVAANGTATLDELKAAVDPAQVPPDITAAAVKAAPGLQVTGAKRRVEDGKAGWALVGTAGGKQVEVEVKADGSTEVEADDGEHGEHGDAGEGEHGEHGDAGEGDHGEHGERHEHGEHGAHGDDD